MAKFLKTQLFPSVAGIKEPSTKTFAEKLINFLDAAFRKVADIPFNNSSSVDVADSGSANTEFSFSHYLNRVPTGFIVTKSDKAASVYDSGTAWTTSTIYLKCDAANTALTIVVY
ncbi:MAG: hypothetical protein ACYS80_26295 [Planctomycetota bacterium]|jgi:hypothetical protein